MINDNDQNNVIYYMLYYKDSVLYCSRINVNCENCTTKKMYIGHWSGSPHVANKTLKQRNIAKKFSSLVSSCPSIGEESQDTMEAHEIRFISPF